MTVRAEQECRRNVRYPPMYSANLSAILQTVNSIRGEQITLVQLVYSVSEKKKNDFHGGGRAIYNKVEDCDFRVRTVDAHCADPKQCDGSMLDLLGSLHESDCLKECLAEKESA